MNPIYFGMGSNLGEREQSLRKGLEQLQTSGVPICRISSLYETDPVGYASQPSFLNIAAEARWAGSAENLLEICWRAEQALGRIRGVRDGPRTLDVDILMMGSLVLATPSLKIPHPRLAARRFVLVPLSEIAPDAVHPVLGLSVRELLRRCPDTSGVRRAGDPPTVEAPGASGYNPAASRGEKNR